MPSVGSPPTQPSNPFGLNIVPTNKTCPSLLEFYGDATTPFDALAGCDAESASSLADVAVTQGQISCSAMAGEAAPAEGGGPPPPALCTATSANGMALTYDQCT